MSHWTDKQIEAWVSPETRLITMPDGSVRSFTMTALSWMAHDELVDTGHYTEEWLVRLAWEDAQRTKRPFELLFPSIVSFVHRERVARLGGD